MSAALETAGRLKADIRLAKAVSEPDADLTAGQKAAFRTQRLHSHISPPTIHDMMRLTAETDRATSSRAAGRRFFGPRLTNVLQAVQQFAALGDVVVGGSQNLVACGAWALVRRTLLSFVNYSSGLDKLSTLFTIQNLAVTSVRKLAFE
ncbi:hypothetical protein QBC34DRAFT_397202 [Podospora aff. communis PSN243]|uniref:Uncharacterized protein n=1 Tax=Podospora aff. communis PSN243 TaxID=3040156 RepID=A0AAV9GV91_9PEZI|nr:hypothetical protein QBC34DRAFT_397202 [Podospora aff. communis PSN243]